MLREKLNIRSDAEDWRARILSNLAHTPFRIGENIFQCVEAPLQGIKFEDVEIQKKVFTMNGIEALRAGREITKSIRRDQANFVHWQGEVIKYNSIEHRLLVAMFIREKIRQNSLVQRALLDTSGTFIFHDVGKENPSTSLPEKFYIEVLLMERRLLKKLISIS